MYSPSSAVGAPSPASRIAGIDAARGVAMVLVCLSHVRIHFSDSAPALYELVTALTRLATPSFLLLSGFVAAHVLSGPDGRLARATLVDRGLFLLVIAHVLIGVGDLSALSLCDWLFARVLVTDAIGVCLLIAVVVQPAPTRTLVTLGVGLVLVSWIVALTLNPANPLEQQLGAMLFSLRSQPNPYIDAALVPYLGIFLLGMSLRKFSAREILSANFDALGRRCLRVGGLALMCAALGIAGWFLAKPLLPEFWSAELLDAIRATLDPRRKFPPSPAYFLAYAGGGAVVAGLCLLKRPRRLMQAIVPRAATIGRASLLCFILQDWLLRLAPVVLGFGVIGSPTFWMLYFAGTVLLLYWISRRWLAIRGNRFLTLGIRRLALQRERHPAAPARQP